MIISVGILELAHLINQKHPGGYVINYRDKLGN